MTTVVPISSSSVTETTVPSAAVLTAAPSSACTSMPLWVRQSAMVWSYSSSVMLNTVTVVPSSGETTSGSSSTGSSMTAGSCTGTSTGSGWITGLVGGAGTGVTGAGLISMTGSGSLTGEAEENRVI